MKHLIVLLCLLAFVACNHRPTEQDPKLLSSAQTLGYAEGLPGRLTALDARLTEREAQTRQTLEAMPEYPKALSAGADPKAMEAIYEAADEDGHSAAMVEHMRQRRTIQSFFTETETDFVRRIAGSVISKLKKDGFNGDAEVGGSIRYAFGKEIEEQLAVRQKAASHAFGLLDQQAPLEKKDKAALETQLPAIIDARFFVSVEAPELLRLLDQGLDDVGDAQDALQDEIERRRAALDAGQVPQGERKEAEKRIMDLDAARQRLAPEAERLKARVDPKTAEENLKKLQADYDKALDALLDALKKR